jgi:hypothetical protein
MAERAFLTAVQSFLASQTFAPSATSIGLAEPADTPDLPAIVLSLEASTRRGTGLGERVATVEGALSTEASIALAAPVLVSDPSFNLLSADRRTLTLPHGGQVRADGSTGALGSADLSVRVNDVVRPVVNVAPTGLELRCDPQLGQLVFATALPLTGQVRASYYLGRWERRVARLEGVLRLDVLAAAADDVAALSDAVLAALLAPEARTQLVRLLAIEITSLSSIGAPESVFAGARRRSARLAFRFEQIIDQPESSGGIIARIPLTTRLTSAALAAGGEITTSVVTEIS